VDILAEVKKASTVAAMYAVIKDVAPSNLARMQARWFLFSGPIYSVVIELTQTYLRHHIL